MKTTGRRSIHATVSRRKFLSVGALGCLGLPLAEFLALRAWAAETPEGAPEATAKSVIHIFLPGGVSAQESFDPKPLAPLEYRGEVGAIGTRLPGVQFSALLPQTALAADKLTLVRSLTHSEAAHERGQHVMLTGYRPSTALSYPSMGSVTSHELGPCGETPAYICIPETPNAFAGSGYLSAAYGPFSLGDDPAREGFLVRDLTLPASMAPDRDERRRRALAIANQRFPERVQADSVAAMNAFYERAFDLVASPSAQAAFRIEQEPAPMRDRYGRHEAGQRMLLARRLVEAGTRFVTLTYGGWDHHEQVTSNMSRLMPAFDQAFAALIGDLDERGMLDETLVLVTSEFGRTPKLNQDAGRDHWARAFSVALAGGGTRRGVVVGSSGLTGGEPEETPVTPEDLAATIYHLLGIAPEKRLIAPGGRPVEIVRDGRVRRELIV